LVFFTKMLQYSLRASG